MPFSALAFVSYPWLAAMFDDDPDKVSDDLDTARQKSVSKQGPSSVQRIGEVTG
jgi:hypothetical protein